MLIKNKYVSHTIRIIIGCVFIASAILKYLSIDTFDLYIYEHQLFNYAITAILTRLLIAAEFALGIMLIGNILIKFTYFTTFLFLAGFTVYLFLQPLLFDVDLSNCHCFGDKIILNHTQSIIKNIVLMLLLLLVNIDFYKWRKYELPIFIALAIVTTTAFMLINAPDFIYKKLFDSNVRIDVELYESTLQSTTKYNDFTSDDMLICMYSNKCKYCKIAAGKIDEIIKQNNIGTDKVRCVFWGTNDSTEIKNFFIECKIEALDYTVIPVTNFLAITNGKMPVILFSEKGKITQSVNYTGLSEKDIVTFLRKE